MARKKQNQKILKPPELPPEIPDDEIEVSDEDVEFFHENQDYAGFISRIDTSSINKHVNRVADVEELYEKRNKSQKQEHEENELQIDPVEALPIKIDGQVVYRKLSNNSEKPEGEEEDGNDAETAANESGSVLRLTKAERRAKLKKSKKAAKQQATELGAVVEEVQQTPQAAILAEVKKDLTAEELYESKKHKLAELGIALLADPESNIKFLREMLQVCKDDDDSISKLGLLSLLAVFKDIIPGYKIRLPTEKELEMKVSNDVKKMRYYESTLLSTYKGYLQTLIMLEKQSKFKHVAVRCICTLLDAASHFNFRESLVEAVVKNIGSADDVIRKLCCDALKSVFRNEGKHGGEATVEAVQLIANHVKVHNCQLHPDSIEVFLSLSIDEDLGKYERSDKESKVKGKKNKKRKNVHEPNQLPENDRKKSKRDLMSKLRDEVATDYKSASLTPNVEEQRRMQSETLSAVFETYFRILKHAMSSTSSSEVDVNFGSGPSRVHPLLSPCLKGLGKFSHLMDLDYIGDLMTYLRRLSGGGTDLGSISNKHWQCLTLSERLQCCIIAFKVMRSNLDALNVDLHGFFVQLYNLILEYRPGRDEGEVLAEGLKIMLCDDRQHDMQKAAAFVKRLATFSLHYGSAESMAALVTLKHLLQKNVKCRNLLENDAGGGSVSGSIAKYQPYASDPNLSGALASVLWELTLLSKHYHPAISTISTNISTMSSAAHNQVYLPTTSPQQAFADLSLERESFNLKCDTRKINGKKKRGSGSVEFDSKAVGTDSVDEDELRKKLSSHFMVLHDFKESERLRIELDRTTLALQLHEEYKQQKKTRKIGTKNGRKSSIVRQ